MPEKKIVDTTLRDGEQRPGIEFTMADKIKLAKLIDSCGVYEIEAGTSNRELEGEGYYEELRNNVKHAKISLWSRMCKEDIEEAILCKPDIVHIGMPVSYVQIYSKLKKNKTWLHKCICECIDRIRSENIEVVVGFEDASRADEGFLIDTARLIGERGGNTIRIADTVGVLIPSRTESIINQIVTKVGISVEFHGHNDLGMVVANSISACKAGAEYVDCTLLGIGERSGNCHLLEFVRTAGRIFNLGIDKYQVQAAENELNKMICEK